MLCDRLQLCQVAEEDQDHHVLTTPGYRSQISLADLHRLAALTIYRRCRSAGLGGLRVTKDQVWVTRRQRGGQWNAIYQVPIRKA